jgi:2OG-Fe(II) oxygenase superfamily
MQTGLGETDDYIKGILYQGLIVMEKAGQADECPGLTASPYSLLPQSCLSPSKCFLTECFACHACAAIEDRIARWTLLPVGNGEGLQVLRYEHDQKYDAHWDYFFHKEGTANGGNRMATVLMYLADTEEGGETVFPNIPAPGGVNEGFSECAKYHLAAKPVKGDGEPHKCVLRP